MNSTCECVCVCVCVCMSYHSNSPSRFCCFIIQSNTLLGIGSDMACNNTSCEERGRGRERREKGEKREGRETKEERVLCQ